MRRKLFLFLPVVLIYLLGFFQFDRWGNLYSRGDDVGYYLHVVAFWINQDTGDYSESLADLVEAHPEARFVEEDPFLIRPTDRGRRYIKYTLGVGLMETPFFLLAHAYASCSEAYRADGWDSPYFLMVNLSNVFFILWGVWILIHVLEPYFDWKVVVLVTLAIALATNLFYHAVYYTMAHGFLFFDHCLLLWLTLSFYRRPTRTKALLLGATVGLIAMTRVPEVISALVPLLWGVTSRETFRQRLLFFRKNAGLLLAGGLGFLLVFSLQLMYWYYVSGQLIFNPYQGEGFDFLRPRIWKGWFDFANGWLIYTPIMTFGLAGLFWVRRYCPAVLVPLLAFVGLHVYIHYSYYAWTYYPGLGQRPMVETYPLLAFGLAAFFQVCADQRSLVFRALPYVAVTFFAGLNLFQTWQSNEGLIWSERHNAAFYYQTFGQTEGTFQSLIAYENGLLQPDTTTLQPLAMLAYDGFEDADRFPSAAPRSFQGSRAFELHPDVERVPLLSPLELGELPPKAWLKASIYGFMPAGDRIWNRDRAAELFVDIMDGDGRSQARHAIKVSCQIGNTDYSIWTAGAADRWGKAFFFVRVPRGANPDWTVQAWMQNNQGQRLFLDAFKLEVFTSR